LFFKKIKGLWLQNLDNGFNQFQWEKGLTTRIYLKLQQYKSGYLVSIQRLFESLGPAVL